MDWWPGCTVGVVDLKHLRPSLQSLHPSLLFCLHQATSLHCSIYVPVLFGCGLEVATILLLEWELIYHLYWCGISSLARGTASGSLLHDTASITHVDFILDNHTTVSNCKTPNNWDSLIISLSDNLNIIWRIWVGWTVTGVWYFVWVKRWLIMLVAYFASI